MKLDMYIMAFEPTSTAYFINPFIILCICMCIPLSLLGNGCVNLHRSNKCTRNNSGIDGRAVFCVVRVVSKESRRLVLPGIYYYSYFTLHGRVSVSPLISYRIKFVGRCGLSEHAAFKSRVPAFEIYCRSLRLCLVSDSEI
jgi:hypothetical protein